MTSWEIIKKEFTKDSREGSVGYSLDIAKAGHLFCLLGNHLKDSEEAKKEFIKETKFIEGVVLNETLKKIGMI